MAAISCMSLSRISSACWWAGLFTLMVGLTAARADIRLVWKVEQKIELRTKPGEKPASPISKKYDLTVVLGPNYFSAITPDLETYVDFKGRSIMRVLRKEKRFTNSSLYSEIALRSVQMSQRLAFRKMQAEGKVKGDPIEIVTVEHLLALRGPDKGALASADATGMSFRYGGKPLFLASPEGRALQGDEAAWFVRFLRYYRPMHPDILAALLARKEVPQEFHSYLNNEHLQYTLAASEVVPRNFDPTAASAGLNSLEGDFFEAVRRAMALTPAEFEKKCEELHESSRAREKTGREFDALLLETEYTLAKVVPQTESLVRLRAMLNNDIDTQRFFGAINAEGKAAASNAADVMRTLRNKSKAGLVTLKFYEAGHTANIGRRTEACRLLIDTLREAPFFASGWKDLGDILYIDHDFTNAWHCWAAARHLLPGHRLFEEIGKIEDDFRKEYPEYF